MDTKHTYGMPYMGCLVGTAYQTLLIQLSEILAKEDLKITTAEYMILRSLYTEDGLQQCELADMIGKDRSAICRTVALMENKGLVNTVQISHKCRRVYLSSKAEELRPRIMKVAEMCHNRLKNLITPDELRVFESILRKIIISNTGYVNR